MDGGIGTSALIGAAVGGGTALVTGNDPLRGALIGGVTGGVGGAIGNYATTGSLLGGAAASAAPAASIGTQVGNTAITNAIPVVNNAATSATQAFGSGITDIATQTPFLGGVSGMAPIGTSSNILDQTVGSVVNAPLQQAYQTAPLIAAGDVVDDALRESYLSQFGGNTVDSAKSSLFDRFNNLSTGEKIGYGIAGNVALQGILGGLNPPQVQVEEEEENPYGFATYDRNVFRPYTPTPNVYRPSYANGGIASLPRNNMFPQGMQNATQYATPTQMPTSAEVVRADYDALTNPYSGEPIGMADGGSLRDAVARYMSSTMKTSGNPTVPTPTRSTPAPTPVVDPSVIESRRAAAERAEQLAQQRAMFGNRGGFWGNTGGYYGGIGGYGGMGGMGGTAYMYGNPMNQRFAQPAPAPNDYIAKDFSPVVSRTANTNIYRPQFAKGGIAGDGHLGDYAAGGMPRLLRGPGDGVSDDIPATIAGKQPARLADGEFVIPARIVSEIGNGSTDAGAKRLYEMMDRVQKKRGKTVGKNKVAVDSKAHKELAKV